MSKVDWTQVITAAVAVVALVQPWAFSLYQNVFNQRQIKFFKTSRPEISYDSDFGSSIALLGVIYSGNRSSLVTRMTATVTHIESQTTRNLTAHLVRSADFTVSAAGTTYSKSLASPFKIAADEMAAYNTIFVDLAAFDRLDVMWPLVSNVWRAYAEPRVTVALGPRPMADQAASWSAQANELAGGDMFEKFMFSPELQPYVEQLEAEFRWPQGRYDVVVCCAIDGAGTATSPHWRFHVGSEDEARLRQNLPLIVRKMCGLGPFSETQPRYPDYEQTS